MRCGWVISGTNRRLWDSNPRGETPSADLLIQAAATSANRFRESLAFAEAVFGWFVEEGPPQSRRIQHGSGLSASS
eukprot:5590819-Amphidinium_carterae.1